MIIETERLYLRELVAEDVHMIYRLHNNKKTMTYMPYNSISMDKARHDVLDYASVSDAQEGYGIWATVLKSDDTVIGWTCLKPLLDSGQIEIGYRYFPEYWNQGYCTEICRQLLKYGFEHLGLNEIIAIIHPDNIGSIRVVEKLKMVFQKHVSHFSMDLRQYSIRAEDYRASLQADVYGSALLDYYQGKIKASDKGWIRSSKHYMSPYDEWYTREQRAIHYARGRVLDIGCAAGRHALYLQGKGLDVIGIDKSLKSIEVSRLRGLEKARTLGLDDLPADLGEFDTIMMLGNNFGLVGTYEGAIRRLKVFDQMLREGGRLILGACGLNMDRLSPDFKDQVQKNLESGSYYGQVLYHLSYKGMTSDLPWLCIEKDDLLDLVRESDFSLEELIEDRGYGQPYPYVLILKKDL